MTKKISRFSNLLYIICAALVIALLSVACFSLITEPRIVAVVPTTINPRNVTAGDASVPLQPITLSTDSEFQCSIVYAYTGKENINETNTVDLNGKIERLYSSSKYPTAVFFNFTKNPNTQYDASDAKVEVYSINITANTGANESYIWLEGTNLNPSYSDFGKAQILISHQLDRLLDRRSFTGQGGHFKFNWTNGESIVGGCVGSIGRYLNHPGGTGLWAYGKPQTIAIDVRIVGWISIEGSTANASLNSHRGENIIHLNFQTLNDGFIYNTIVPNDRLACVNLFNPESNAWTKSSAP